jgi:hypothetical protein
MGFSAKQLKALRRNLDHRYVRTREANDRTLSYIEGWYAISEANRIFGFDGWNRETIESRCVLARENRGSFVAVYTARVRISVQADGTTIIREGHGTGEGRSTSAGEVLHRTCPLSEESGHLSRCAGPLEGAAVRKKLKGRLVSVGPHEDQKHNCRRDE